MNAFKTIVRLTFLELIRKKVLYFTVLMSAVFLAVYGTGLYFVFREYKNIQSLMQLLISTQMLTMGLYTASLVIAFLAVFISAGSISGALEQNAFDVILTAPIKRHTVILGRYTGILCVMLPYSALLFGAVLLMNGLMGHGVGVQISAIALIKALGIIWLMPITLTALGLYLSTRLAAAPAGIVITLVYFCGVIGGFMEKIGSAIPEGAGAVLVKIGILSGLVIPTDPIYRMAFSKLMTTESGLNLSASSMLGAASQPSGAMLVYSILYILFFLGIAIRHFDQKDL